MTHRAGRRASWPVEVRELYDTVIRTAEAKETGAFAAALDRLVMLADHGDDAAVRKAAKLACVKLALRYDPEGFAACIANVAEFPDSLRPLIGARAPGSRPRSRRGRGRGHGPG